MQITVIFGEGLKDTGGIANRPGLVLTTITDRAGRKTRRWTRPSMGGDHMAPKSGDLHPAELHNAAHAHAGGGAYLAEAPDIHGAPLYVPHEHPHEAWDRHRAAIAQRIGDVGDTGDGHLKIATWGNDHAFTADEVAAVAAEAKPRWVEALHGIAKSVPGAEATMGENDKHATKAVDGIRRKIEKKAQARRERGLPVDEAAMRELAHKGVGDAVRGSIVVDTPEQLGDVVRAAQARFRAMGGDMVVDNKWAQPTDTGYAAVHADVYIPTSKGPVRAELQFHPRAMLAPKGQSHGIYEVTRQTGFNGNHEHYNKASKLVWLAAMRRLHKES